MTGMMLVIMLGAIEQTVVAVALPVIAGQLSGFASMAWVISAYLIASTVATPIYGKLSDTYGCATILTVAILLFTLSSIACALATSMPQLILFRVLQGLGGGGLISVAQATIGQIVPLSERGRYQGYISGVFAGASLAGPIVGGYLTQYLSWRAIFWINLPLGVLALVIVRRALRQLPVSSTRRSVDYLGALLLAMGLTSLLLVVTHVGHGESVLLPANLGLIGLATAALLLFVRHEGNTPEPIIPLPLLCNPTIAISCTLLFLAFFQFIAMSVLLPLWWQAAGGVAPDAAALRLLWLTLAIPAGAFLAGRWMSNTGRYRPLQLIGTLAAAAATGGLALCTPDQVSWIAVNLCVLGAGIGFQFPTSLVAAQNAVAPNQLGVATALTSLSRLLGGAVGVALMSALLAALLRHALQLDGGSAAAGISPGGASLAPLLATVLENGQQAGGREVVHSAFRTLFLISAGIAAVAPLLVLRLQEQTLRGSE